MKNLTLALFVMLLCACSQNEDITINIIENTALTVDVVDNNDAPIANAPIFLSTRGSYDYSEKKQTNSTGQVEFTELIAGSYNLNLDKITVNGQNYYPEVAVELAKGTNKKVRIKPTEHVGSLIFEVTKYFDDQSRRTPISNAKMYVIEKEDALAGITLKTLAEKSIANGVTDEKGILKLLMPSNHYFLVFVVIDEANHVVAPLAYIAVEKDETNTFSKTIYSNELITLPKPEVAAN